MAIDEALLESVARNPEAAVVRTYEWSTPTLSLGYFQSYRLPDAEPRWRDAAVVRRPTGGGAIWHDQEITYTVVIPRTHPLAHKSADLYRSIHSSLAVLLRDVGLTPKRRGEGEDVASQTSRPLLCFLDKDPEDIVVGVHKLIGSAQRRRVGAVLQHGSILLSDSSRTPELPGVHDLAGRQRSREEWANSIMSILPQALGLSPCPSKLTFEERREADALAHVVYRSPTWNHRR
jgi:lipoate-protein ligase A